MKKMVALAMAATMALSLTACGSSEKPAETAAPATEAAAPAEGSSEAAPAESAGG